MLPSTSPSPQSSFSRRNPIEVDERETQGRIREDVGGREIEKTEFRTSEEQSTRDVLGFWKDRDTTTTTADHLTTTLFWTLLQGR